MRNTSQCWTGAPSSASHPVAIRVPGGVIHGEKPAKDYGDLNKYEVCQKGSDVAIIALGTFFGMGMQAAEEIEKRTGVKPRSSTPFTSRESTASCWNPSRQITRL